MEDKIFNNNNNNSDKSNIMKKPIEQSKDIPKQDSNEGSQTMHFKFENESPVEAASRFASLAEQQEMAKNYVLAQEYNESARKYYLEAMAYMK